MSLKPQPPRPLPEELARLGAVLLPADSPYRLIGDQLYVQYRDEDFADLYHREGKPGLSPVLLAFVTVFQCLENLSDRKAVEALKFRIDWKYALHLPLAYAGFDSSVLCEFRQRLITHEAEGRVFDRVLEQVRDLGLLKHRGTQRTDSLALLTRARTLRRLELVFETLRVALRALLRADADWLTASLPATWADRYQYHCRVERHSEAERQALEAVVGDDGQWLLDRLAADDTPETLRDLPAIAILRTVWEQQFEAGDMGRQFKAKSSGTGAERIETPYDPEAHWSKKGTRDTWTGYKLQATETADADYPHLITDIAVTGSTENDRSALVAIAERQEQRGVLPGERYADQGYLTGPALAAAEARGEDLIGPIQAAPSPQAKLPDGFTHADFQIDVAARTATCPAGHPGTAKDYVGNQDKGDKGIVFTFQWQHCRDCPLRARCVTGKRQRYLIVREHYERVQQARARQKTEAFQRAYQQHRPGVEGCLSALIRGQGIRHCRYAGRKQNNLRALFIGAAVNLARSAAWLAGKRHRPKRQGLPLAARTG